MNNELLRIATHVMIICLLVLIYAIARAYYSERERRKFYEKRYYSEPRVYHYKKKKGFWLVRFLFPIIIIMLSCTKEDMPQKMTCYSCTVYTPGIKKSFDTCLADITQLDMTNEIGIGLPWSCREKQ